MKGEVNSKTFGHLKKIVNENPQITTILLVDVPGSLDDETNLKMCNWIRDKELNTYLSKDIPKEHEDHEMNRKYIEDMLGKDEFYWYTIYAAPADDIYYMTLEEIERYQLYTHLIKEQ